MSRPDSVGSGNGDPDADPDMTSSTTEQPNQAEGDDVDAEDGG
ncbi:hypothetical protein [Mycolicibacterium grossiae]|nr:hypothetical protein [Mycolicibacterium grossiae]